MTDAEGWDDWDGITEEPDADLVRLLSGAWRRWFGQKVEPTAPLGVMTAIQLRTPEGQAGRPADAVGVSASRWNRWLMWERGVTDRQGRRLGVQPSAKSLERMREVLRRSRVDDGATPTGVRVTAVIVWNAYVNGKDDPLGKGEQPPIKRRTTTLTGLDLTACRASWATHQDHRAAQELLLAVVDTYGTAVDLIAPTKIELIP